jgi:Tol biopolymer transport system component
MGEVYRAKDPRLGREVAIKVLPATFSQDADRLKRFEQEARAAGVLNHPNITAVYDLGAHDGSPYIVTELLEGETLRSRLGSGALPPRKAIDYAIQIAKGLAAAHEKGIVHRDLKPENLFVTKDGRVKILDFGLAKLKSEKDGEGQTDLKTVSGTEPGVVLGTMGYMSPEQVRGKAADRRSDLFSFGTILFEMLTGQRAFRGETAADTITAILTKEPPDLSQTNKDIHPGLDRIVRHCLEKNPEERFESARDLAFDLEALSGVSTASTPLAAAAEAAAGTTRRRWIPAAAAGVAGLAAGAAAGLWTGRRLYERSSPTFRQLTFRRGQIPTARFAPDGQTILYTASWDGRDMEIFQTRLDSPESRPFGLTGAEVLSISSSGEMAVSLGSQTAGAFTRRGTLARIGITGGGAPREILERVIFADWSPNGKDLAIVREVGGKSQLEFPIGKVLHTSAGWLSHPKVSPRGDEVAIVEHPVNGDDGGFVLLVSAGGQTKTLSPVFASLQGLCWAPGGNEIWFTGSRVGFNRFIHAASRSGRVRTLAEATGGLTLCDVSREGRVLVSQDKARQHMAGLPPGAEKEVDLSWLDWSLVSGISADGTTMLFDESGEGGGPGYSVYVRKLDGSAAVRLGEGSSQSLTADGKRALVIVNPATKPRLAVYPTGAGEPRFIETPGLSVQSAEWMPDGKGILIAANEPGRGIRIYLLEGERDRPRALTPEGYRMGLYGISPDGKTVLVIGPDSRQYLYPIAGGEPTPVPGLQENEGAFGWSPDGRSVYVRRRGGAPARIFLLDVKTGQREPWKTIMPADAAGVTAIGGSIATRDGKTYVYSYLRSLADLYVVEGLK